MAFTDLGTMGATGSTAADQATLVLTTTAAAAVGELVVLVIAEDNQLTVDGPGQEIAWIVDNSTNGPNAWIRAADFANSQGASQAGASVQIWYTVVQTAIASSGTITVTFCTPTLTDATGITARHFSMASCGVEIAATNTLATDAADPAALDATTPGLHCLRIRGIAGEVGNNTSLTPTASWTAWDNGNSATSGTTAEMCARAEHIITTGTGSSSNPTWVSCDNASAYVAFKESAIIRIFETSMAGGNFDFTDNYQARHVVGGVNGAPPIRRNTNYIRVNLKAGDVDTLVVAHVAIGITTAPPDTVAVPTEFKFSGANGFSTAANSTITSDWLPFKINSGQSVLVTLNITSGGVPDQFIEHTYAVRYDLANGSTWNVANVTEDFFDFIFMGLNWVEVWNFTPYAPKQALRVLKVQ